MARVFITGGGGFLANHLAEHLIARGDSVSVLVRSPGKAGLPKGAALVIGDLVGGQGPLIPRGTEVVYHLAAKSNVQESTADPRPTYAVNAMGTARLLEDVRARRLKVHRFVLASTGQVYGPPFGGRLAETHALQPRNVYSASKAAAEHFAIAASKLYGIPVSILRLFNVYGPGQRPELVVSSVLSQCLWSPSLKIGNPWPVRDFLFVKDAVRLFAVAGERSMAAGEVFNAGSGRGTSIAEMVRKAVKATECGLTPHSERSRSRSNDFDRLVADPGKAKRLLGWAPTTTLEEGLALTAAWMRAKGAR